MRTCLLCVLALIFSSTLITAQEVASITITPAATIIVEGEDIQFEATAYDAENNIVEATITWSVEGDIGEITEEGEFAATTAGTGTVTAAVNDISASAEVTVVEEPDDVPEFVPLEISPPSSSVEVGDTVQFQVVVRDGGGDLVEDPHLVWEVSSTEVGTIDENGLFTAVAAGEATVSATSGEETVTAEITVTEIFEEETPEGEQVLASIEVFPSEVTVAIGDTVQFEVEARDSEGEEIEVQNVEWSLDNPEVGSIDSTGKFIPSGEGESQVIALIGDISGSAVVTVVEEILLGPGVNTISVQRQHPDGKITQFGSIIVENSSITLGGIPYPFNFINGGILFFPEGSLDDDIVITIKLPSFAKMDKHNKNVDFGEGIVSAVTFEVSVNGEAVSPFYFNIPIVLTLPYKRGLLQQLGIDPATLGLYYVTETGELVQEGISDIVVDLEANTITGIIAHFSNIAMVPENVPSMAEENLLPSAFSLSQNYPNPFNPKTTISYHVAGSSYVTIDMYNIVGQHVITLVNELKPAGSYAITWDGKDSSGAQVTSGIYFCRMKAGNSSQTRKLMLMK